MLVIYSTAGGIETGIYHGETGFLNITRGLSVKNYVSVLLLSFIDGKMPKKSFNGFDIEV